LLHEVAGVIKSNQSLAKTLVYRCHLCGVTAPVKAIGKRAKTFGIAILCDLGTGKLPSLINSRFPFMQGDVAPSRCGGVKDNQAVGMSIVAVVPQCRMCRLDRREPLRDGQLTYKATNSGDQFLNTLPMMVGRIEHLRRDCPDNGMPKHSVQSSDLLLKVSTLQTRSEMLASEAETIPATMKASAATDADGGVVHSVTAEDAAEGWGKGFELS
jgi:hypothetical protein